MTTLFLKIFYFIRKLPVLKRLSNSLLRRILFKINKDKLHYNFKELKFFLNIRDSIDRELFKLANKFVFIVIACYPAKKTLPDGRNVHLCIKSVKDWKKIIKDIRLKFSNISPYVICATERKQFVAVS